MSLRRADPREGQEGQEGPTPQEAGPGPGAVSLDDSLTSLQWLQEFSYLGGGDGPQPPRPGSSSSSTAGGGDAPASPAAGDPASLGAPLTPGKPTAAAFSRGHCPGEVDYRTEPYVKPPYSYAMLIYMAMQASRRSKLTLSCIYKWITDNFCYFRYADPTWRNSIRHNLSLNKCFLKVPREKDEPGKGGFWRMDPEHADQLLKSAVKRRGVTSVQVNPALQNRLRLPAAPPQPRGPCASLWVGPEAQHLLREFERATGADQNRDPHPGSWPAGGHKRRPAPAPRAGAAKAPRRSSSPLLSADEQRELGSLKGNFDWDSLLASDLSGDLCLEGGPGPLSPIAKEEEPGEPVAHVLAETRRNRGADFDEETYLATSLLENPWTEEEEQSHSDFLCSSAVNLDQLLALGDSLGMELSNKIETLL